MPEVIIQLIIVMLICGLVYYGWTLLRPIFPLPGPFGQIVDALVLILIAVIVVFYAIIPLLRMLPRLLH